MRRHPLVPSLCLLFAACGEDTDARPTSATAATSATSVTSATSATTTAASTDPAPLTDGMGSEATANPGASSVGSTTGADTTAAGTTGGASTSAPKLDVGAVPDFGGETGDGAMCEEMCQADKAGQVGGDWRLHISSANALMLVDVSDGSTTEVCKVTGIGFIKSLTFTRTNRLLASDGAILYEIDPCTCKGAQIGVFSPGYGSIYGISPDEGDDLFGISAQANALVRIDSDTAKTTEIGPLGGIWGNHGATWSEQEQRIYAINGGTNSLYTVDPQTGAATLIAKLSVTFSTVGAEIHPATGRLYGCTGTGKLYEIDKATAKATEIGAIQGIGTCTNLGAPWTGSDVCLPVPG